MSALPKIRLDRTRLAAPQVLEKLCQIWVKLARRLREAEVAHGDLQHGNVLLVPIRTGVGARLGVNLGYLKLTQRPTWNPF